MKRYIFPITVVILLLVIVVVLFIFSYLGRNKQFEQTKSIGFNIEQESSSLKPFVIQEVPVNKNTVSGQKVSSSSKAFIRLQNSWLKPNAFQIKATYNQSEVEITNITIGDIWTDSNVLINSIDTATGTIKFAAGQGFSAEDSEGNTLFIVTYKKMINTSGNIGLVIHPESKFGFKNQSNLQPLNPTVLSVSLE